MKIYIAGAWTMRQELGLVMAQVEELGHTITHNWTSHELVYSDVVDRDKKCGTADINGVIDADLVIAVMTLDDYPYKGTRHELGAAYAMQQLKERGIIEEAPQVWIVSNGNNIDTPDNVPECLQTCFTSLANRYYNSIDQALESLST
jgi:hypothetical protein